MYIISPEVARFIISSGEKANATPAYAQILKDYRKAIQIGSGSIYVGAKKYLINEFTYGRQQWGKREFICAMTNRYTLRRDAKTSELWDNLSKTDAEEAKVYTMSKWWKSLLKMIFSPDWLMTGSQRYFQNSYSAVYTDIVYFDVEGFVGKKKINFGTKENHSAYSFSDNDVREINELFIEKKSPIGEDGETYKAIIGINPLSWYKREKIIIAESGIRYSRPTGFLNLGGYKTSYIPFDEVYHIIIQRYNLFFKKIMLFGSQNIESNRSFSDECVGLIKKSIEKKCPHLDARNGIRYGNFSWNPFAGGKYSVYVTDKGYIFRHPQEKIT